MGFYTYFYKQLYIIIIIIIIIANTRLFFYWATENLLIQYGALNYCLYGTLRTLCRHSTYEWVYSFKRVITLESVIEIDSFRLPSPDTSDSTTVHIRAISEQMPKKAVLSTLIRQIMTWGWRKIYRTSEGANASQTKVGHEWLSGQDRWALTEKPQQIPMEGEN